MKIYISGQITGLTEKEYVNNFNYETLKLVGRTMVLRNDVINPLDIIPLFGIKKWLFFMISDIAALRKCTHIAMQKNWIESRGACIEYYCAKFIFKQKIIWL